MNSNRNEGITKELTEKLSDRQLLLLLLDGVNKIDLRLSAIEEEQRRTRYEIALFREDLHNERRERSYLEERLIALEQAQALLQ